VHWSALLRDVEYTRGGVPKILHQIWINERPDPPVEWAAARAKWKAHHPEWKHVIWCKRHARACIAQWHPTFVDGYPHEIQRIDMIRYFFLYDFGYCDLDQ
jgi:mannosyltransferase OCH1-like enzyme